MLVSCRGDGAAVLRFFDETFKDSITHTGSAGKGGGMEGVVPLRFNVDGTLVRLLSDMKSQTDIESLRLSKYNKRRNLLMLLRRLQNTLLWKQR